MISLIKTECDIENGYFDHYIEFKNKQVFIESSDDGNLIRDKWLIKRILLIIFHFRKVNSTR